MIRRVMMVGAVLALLIAGCSSEDDRETDPDVGVPEDADSAQDVDELLDADLDVDVDAAADTGDDADVQDADTQDADVGEDNDLTIEIRFTGEVGDNWRAGAFLTHFEEFEDPGSEDTDEFPVIQAESASTVLDAEVVSLTIPEPQDEDYGELFDGLEGAAWILAIYDDVDETGQRDEEDPTEAVRGGLIIYPAEEIPDDDEPIPAETWIGIDVDIETDDVTPIDMDEPIELSALSVTEEVTIGGTMDAELLADTTHLSSLVAADPPIITPNPPLNEPITTEEWEASIDEPVHKDRLAGDIFPFPLEAVVEIIVGYQNTNGELTQMDQVTAFGCHDESLFSLMYVVEIVDPAEALLVHLLGLYRGWSPVRATEDGPSALAEDQWDEVYFAVSPDECGEPQSD